MRSGWGGGDSLNGGFGAGGGGRGKGAGDRSVCVTVVSFESRFLEKL